MFYSHQILARKGPLATVWIAAHLQHRLRKSHYTATDIPSTVDRIMFPEAPIALRLSSHLLLGVVRIYSKKVDYLHHDCNVILIGISKAFASTEVTLPEHAATAPLESITLPERYDLDAMELDDDLLNEGDQDKYLKSQEEITLPDEIPVGKDPYIVITFDEDILMDTSQPEDQDFGIRPMEKGISPPILVDAGVASEGPALNNDTDLVGERLKAVSDIGVRPMEEDINPQISVDPTVGFQDPGRSNKTGVVNERTYEDNSPQEYPEIEVMRDAVHDFQAETLPLWPDPQDDITKSQTPAHQNVNEKETPSPVLEHTLLPEGHSPPLQQRSEPPASVITPEVPEIFDDHISFGQVPPEVAIRSTPQVEQPKRRQRKRKWLIDETIVLTNKFMKKRLEDSSDLLRQKNLRPGSLLGDWKLRNRIRKEQIFLEPSITGMCLDLLDVFREDFISTKPHLVISEEVFSEPRVARSPTPIPHDEMETEGPRQPEGNASPAPIPDNDMEIERLRQHEGNASPAPVPDHDIEIECLRQHEGNAGNNVMLELFPSPGPVMASPFRRDDFTPISVETFGSDSQWGTSVETGALPTPGLAASTGTLGSEMETPTKFFDDRTGLGSIGLSDIPELISSAREEELSFLEADNNTPNGSQGMHNVDTLSVRTRAVAQYLKRHSPVTQSSEDPSGKLNMNQILEGKSRKVCARMFYATLVLKSNGLIDLHQEAPYGDINLKLSPKLMAQF